ncbi:MAG: MBL fold metallo-hydrolase [Butyrivibrio sp.]|nr:MBL fold metallo-hydrolase [Butyrivibrio sp.]
MEEQGRIKLQRMTLGPVETNTYLVSREGVAEAMVFDPADRGDWIAQRAQEQGLHITRILLTHAHFDHIGGVAALVSVTGAEVIACAEERELCEDAGMNLSRDMGVPITLQDVRYCADGAVIGDAGLSCRLIATPGHTAGGCCYYFEQDHILICGDTLFAGSVGRTDFPTGSMSTLIRSIRERLLVLPEDTICYPGHGDETSIGEEKRYNPFLS